MEKNNFINEVSIVNLADDIQYLEEASTYIWNQWHKEIGTSLGDIIYRSRHSIYKDRVPQMYIAKYKDELVGVTSIWNNDLMARQDLIPWLATAVVKREYQKKGIGTLMQNKCIQVVHELGYKNLYVITDHEGYYEKNGWNFLEMVPMGQGRYKRLYEYEIK